MIYVKVIPDTDVLDAVRESARQAPARMRRAAGLIARGKTAQRLIVELSQEPGAPRYPLRWKSARQRRKVMAMLREAGNLPYVRTHKIAQGWRVVLERLSDGEGVFGVVNTAPGVEFVEGDYAQPYHLDTGWPQAAPIITRYADDLQDELINAWYRVVSL